MDRRKLGLSLLGFAAGVVWAYWAFSDPVPEPTAKQAATWELARTVAFQEGGSCEGGGNAALFDRASVALPQVDSLDDPTLAEFETRGRGALRTGSSVGFLVGLAVLGHVDAARDRLGAAPTHKPDPSLVFSLVGRELVCFSEFDESAPVGRLADLFAELWPARDDPAALSRKLRVLRAVDPLAEQALPPEGVIETMLEYSKK